MEVARGERANGILRTYRRRNTKTRTRDKSSNVPPMRVSAHDSKQKPSSLPGEASGLSVLFCRYDKNGRRPFSLKGLSSSKTYSVFAHVV